MWSRNRVGFKLLLASVIILGFIIRLIWIVIVPTLPASDFYYYHNSAEQLSKNIVNVGKNMGFISLLSFGYRIFPNILTGQIINTLFSTLSIFLIYVIGNKLINRKVGLLGALIFSIFPSEIIMCGVIGTEVTTTTIYLLVFIFTIQCKPLKNRKFNMCMLILSGFFFGLGYTFRSSTIFYLPGLFLLILLSKKFDCKRKAFFLFCFIIGALLGILLIAGNLSFISGEFTLDFLSSQDLYPLLSGTNTKYSGQWNLEDSNLYGSWPMDKRNELVIQTATKRILSDVSEFFLLIIRKMGLLMGTNNYGTYWGLEQIDWGQGNPANNYLIENYMWDRTWQQNEPYKNFIISISDLTTQSTYAFVWIFCVFATKYFWSNKSGLYVFVIILLTILPHILFEVQGRYHHYIMPFVILFSSFGLLKFYEENVCLKIN